MSVNEKLHSCDKFGARLQIKAAGKVHATTGGSLVSILFRIVVLSYLLLQLNKLVDYQDPVIGNYDINVFREDSEPISLSDYNMHLKFFFMGPSGRPIPLKP